MRCSIIPCMKLPILKLAKMFASLKGSPQLRVLQLGLHIQHKHLYTTIHWCFLELDCGLFLQVPTETSIHIPHTMFPFKVKTKFTL